MTEPTGVFTLPDNKLTRTQAAALRRLIRKGADPGDLALVLQATYRVINADAEDRSVKGRAL